MHPHFFVLRLVSGELDNCAWCRHLENTQNPTSLFVCSTENLMMKLAHDIAGVTSQNLGNFIIGIYKAPNWHDCNSV